MYANSADSDQTAPKGVAWSEFTLFAAGLGGSVGCSSDWWSGGRGFNPRWVGNILSWRFDHEIFSTVILSFPLIQEG